MNFFLIVKKQKLIIKKSIEGASLKILINYLQIISIIQNLKLDWNENIIQFNMAINSASGNFSRIISFDCIFQGFFIIFIHSKKINLKKYFRYI